MNSDLTFKKYLLPTAAALFLAICISYGNSIHAPFNFDDEIVVKQNKQIEDVNNYLRIKPITYRQIFYLTFAVNYHFGQLDPLGYHLLNIFLHFLTSLAILLFAFITIDKGTDWGRGAAVKISITTAFFFALNPMHTETVTYISGRSSGLSGCFYLFSFLFFVLGGLKTSRQVLYTAGFWTLSFFTAGLAVLSKETTAVLPLMIILYDMCFMKSGNWIPLKKRLYFFYLPLPVLGFIFLASTPTLVGEASRWLAKLHPGYALQQVKVIAYAFKLNFFPVSLVFDHDFQYSFSTDTLRVVTTILLLIGIFYGLWRLYKKHPLVSFCLAWFLITIAPTNSFLPRMDLLSERNMYLPSFGLTFLFASLVYLGVYKSGKMKRFYVRSGDVCLILIFVFFAALVINRNMDYRSHIALWEDTNRKSPAKVRVYHNLSHYYYHETKDYQKAFVMLKKLAASRATPYYLSYAHMNLGNIYAHFGDYEKAETEFLEGIRHDPTLPTGYFNLGVLYATKEKYNKAMQMLKTAEERQRVYPGPYLLPPTLNLYKGRVNYHLRNYKEAFADVKKALPVYSNMPETHLLLAKILLEGYNDEGQAKTHLKAAEGLNPDPKSSEEIKSLLNRIKD